jgi:hypothetical protein
VASAFLGISGAMLDALVAVPAVAGGRVLRGRETPLQERDTSGVRINAVNHSGAPASLAGDDIRWTSLFTVEVLARCAAGVDAEATIDPLLVATWSRINAITWPATVEEVDVQPAISLEIDEADKTIVRAVFAVRVTHYTDQSTLAAASA